VISVQRRNRKRYAVYESEPFGTVRVAAMLEAPSDREALKQAREILPNGAGELREGGRIVYRFGRECSTLVGRGADCSPE
jgi:hypothetical protein